MKKANKGIKAIQIFYEYDRFENRLPTKKEFDRCFYGRELERGESNWYYKVRKKFLQEQEEELIQECEEE